MRIRVKGIRVKGIRKRCIRTTNTVFDARDGAEHSRAEQSKVYTCV